MFTDVHQDFLMDLVDVASNCFREYHFLLDCVRGICKPHFTFLGNVACVMHLHLLFDYFSIFL